MHELKHSKYKPTFKYKALWHKQLNSLPPTVSNFAAMAFLKKYVPIHVYQLKKSIYMLIVRTKK